ncbi:ExbD/TolR family protein [Hydrogenophaga defluvii]|uniref:ExbD/TolR family protein n=1 Tax=Hydrogenophaga defluvii TaxID=249410 RepID=A0ABW2SAF0_9BURK
MSFGQLERDGFDTAGSTPMSDINVTPLVDVMLVLLVIFMVTAPLMVSGLKIDLPQAQATAPVKTAGSVSVVLDRELRLFVDERLVPADALERQLTEIARTDPDTEVLLRVDATVPYGRVAALIGQVQSAGLSRIGFVAEPGPTQATAR